MLPYWLFNPYLRLIRDEQAPVAESPTVAGPAPAAEPAPALPVEVECAQEFVGRYQGKPIPAWVRVNGQQLDFDRVAPQARIAAGEFLLDDCLVYRSQS